MQEHFGGHRDGPLATERHRDEGRRGQGRERGDANNADLKTNAEMLLRQAKLYATNAAWERADRAVQLFGGRGWSTLYRPAGI